MNAKTFLAALAVAGASLVGASQVSAMPFAPQPATGVETGGVEQVRFGCPRGYTPNRYGRCQMMRYRGGYYGRRIYRRW